MSVSCVTKEKIRQTQAVSGLRAFRRVTSFLLCLGFFFPLYALIITLNKRMGQAFFYHFCKLCGHCLNLRILVEGTPFQGPTLFLANHISYLDIPILAAVLKANFISKAEVRQWPLIGAIAALQGCVFVSRRQKEMPHELQQIAAAMKAGHRLILFPEGTTTDGARVLPFKSSFLKIFSLIPLENHPAIQPVSIALRALDNRPVGRFFRKLYGWHGDIGFFPHLWALTGWGTLTIQVTLHPPLKASDYPSRAALASAARQVIADHLLGGPPA